MFGVKNKNTSYDKDLYRRLILYVALIAALFVILGLRLFSIQILQGDEFTTKSSNNQIRVITQPARRGNIYDTNMTELANSKVVFGIGINLSDLSRDDRTLFAENLPVYLQDPEITAETITEQINAHSRKYEPLILTRVSYDENIDLITTLEENRALLPGLYILEEPQRNYPNGTLAGHLLGYMGSINEDEQNLIDEYDYLASDLIGKSGLERTMERFTDNDGNEIGLRGKRGVQTVEVDSTHKAVRILSEEPAVTGNSLVLTIDAKVQAVMEQSLKENIERVAESRPKAQAGAAVLVNVKTGGVIAMASYPELNPNDFVNRMSTETANYYFSNDAKPLLNRVISTAYPPGSTFKPSTAMAIRAAGVVADSFTVVCTPSNWVKPMANCTGSHGTVNLTQAMAKSCNTYFQIAARMTGIDNMSEVFKQLGYGQLTGIELPAEVRGTLANPEWKAANFEGDEGEWRIYDTYYMSMGQGYSNYNVLQMANAIATIANDGARMQSYLVDRILDSEENVVYQMEPTVVSQIDTEQADFDAVKAAMRAVCQPGGTANSLFSSFPVAVAAKTGTAQTGLRGDDRDEDYHGWFVAFAPYDDPEVAYAGLIEYGYHGSTSSGYVCKDVLTAYFSDEETIGINYYDEQGNIIESGIIE